MSRPPCIQLVFFESIMMVAARVIGQSTIVGIDKVGIVATDTYELWLLNDTDELIELDACELFGFGMGAYVAKAAGCAIYCYI